MVVLLIKICFVVYPTSGFPVSQIVEMEGSYLLLSYKD